MKEIIFEKANAEPLINETHVPEPLENQLLVKSLWTAINPVDAMVSTYGILAESWPVGLGVDSAGVVVKAGTLAQQKYGFKVGDYVCGCTRIGIRGYNTGSELFLMDAFVTMRKPGNLSLVQAATIGVAFQTAGLGLFEQGLQIAMPRVDSKGDAKELDPGQWLLVVGGAGSVGRACVQLATAAGYNVIASCSEKSFASVKAIGAKATFDYHLSLEEQLAAIHQASAGAPVTKIFDATSAEDPVLAKSYFKGLVGQGRQKAFVTTNDWSNIGDFEGGKTYEIHLGLIGRPSAGAINAAIEKINPLVTALFEAGKLSPQEHEVVGEGGLESVIQAYKHSGKNGKVVAKIQDE